MPILAGHLVAQALPVQWFRPRRKGSPGDARACPLRCGRVPAALGCAARWPSRSGRAISERPGPGRRPGREVWNREGSAAGDSAWPAARGSSCYGRRVAPVK